MNLCHVVNKIQILALLFVAVGLAGCGYKPIHQNDPQETGLSDVHIQSVRLMFPDRAAGERRVAQIIDQDIERRFTGGENAPLQIEVTVEENQSSLAVQRDATVLRFMVHLQSEVFIKGPDGKQLARLTPKAESTYNVEDSPFATEASRRQARQSAARVLARQIFQQVSLFVYDYNQAQKSE